MIEYSAKAELVNALLIYVDEDQLNVILKRRKVKGIRKMTKAEKFVLVHRKI